MLRRDALKPESISEFPTRTRRFIICDSAMASVQRNLGDIAGFRVHCRIWDPNSLGAPIADILERHGLEPAPERSRKTTWKEFLTQHWELIVAADFSTIEVWTTKGLQRFIVLFFIELSTRRVEIGGISAAANGLWMSQIARNLTDSVDGLLTGQALPDP